MKKVAKIITALAAAVTLTLGSAISASACTGFYLGSELTQSGSSFMGRSEDIGKLYNKIFEVHPAEDHEEGAMYEDTYGFSMPYPSHTYRYTVVKDSPLAEETMQDENGNWIGEAYGSAGTNENGVSMTATVSTSYNKQARKADPNVDTGICEISLVSVVLSQATSARQAVELLAGVVDEHGSGECNSVTISDAKETWTFDTLSGHQYVGVKMPDDKASVNPNMMVIDAVDVNDTENVVASPDLVNLPKENGFLVTTEDGKIDVAKTYGATDYGSGQYVRYWQGVHYLNEELSKDVNVDYTYNDEGKKVSPEGPFNFLFDTDRKLSTLEAFRFLAYRGEGTKYDSNTTGCYAIGNPNQAECHVFETRQNMPAQLAQLEWLALSRAEYSIFLPYYSSLLTETDEIFAPIDDSYTEDSFYWVLAKLNDTCDNNRELYGANVQKFWEGYQQKLIEQQAAVDEDMIKVYEYDTKLAEEKATALGKAVAKEAYGYAKEMLAELEAFIAAGTEGEFVPTVLTEGKAPTYSFDMIGGTGLPEEDVISVSLDQDPAVYNMNEEIVMTVVTKDSVADIGMKNENGVWMSKNAIKSKNNGNGTKTWTVKFSVGTAGDNRVMNLYTRIGAAAYEDSGKTVSMTILQPEYNGKVLEVESVATAKVNESFTATITTTADVEDIRVLNERGNAVTLQSKEVEAADGMKTWTVSLAVGSAGANRIFSVVTVNPYTGKSVDNNMSLPITITK